MTSQRPRPAQAAMCTTKRKPPLLRPSRMRWSSPVLMQTPSEWYLHTDISSRLSNSMLIWRLETTSMWYCSIATLVVSTAWKLFKRHEQGCFVFLFASLLLLLFFPGILFLTSRSAPWTSTREGTNFASSCRWFDVTRAATSATYSGTGDELTWLLRARNRSWYC